MNRQLSRTLTTSGHGMNSKILELKSLLVVFVTVMVATSMPIYSQERTYPNQRRMMVEEQIMSRGVTDPGVVKAMGEVPRHAFVPDPLRDQSYIDGPLAIGSGQTISQPYIVALMTSLLRARWQ